MDETVIEKAGGHFARRSLFGLGLISLGSMVCLFTFQFIIMFNSFTYVKVDPKIENYKFDAQLVNNNIECNPQFRVKYSYNDKECHSTVEIINPPHISFTYDTSYTYQQIIDKCTQLVTQNSEHQIGKKLNDDAYVLYMSKHHHLIKLLRNPKTGEYKGQKQSVVVLFDSVIVLYIWYFGLIVLMLYTSYFIVKFGMKVLKKTIDDVIHLRDELGKQEFHRLIQQYRQHNE